MALSTLKCPYLAQLTLQQVRALSPQILNAGAQSCPVFGPFVRKISKNNINNSINFNTASPSVNFERTQVVHAKVFQQKALDEIKMPATTKKESNPYGKSKNIRLYLRFLISFLTTFLLKVIISTECEDLLCPFLKATPITLRRFNTDQDTIEVNQKLGK